MKRKNICTLSIFFFFLLSGAWEGISFEFEIILIAMIKENLKKNLFNFIICL